MALSLIAPLLEYMDQDQLRILIAAAKNPEVKHSFQYPRLVYTMKHAGFIDLVQLASAIEANGLNEHLAHILDHQALRNA
jgi:hypothetical protein